MSYCVRKGEMWGGGHGGEGGGADMCGVGQHDTLQQAHSMSECARRQGGTRGGGGKDSKRRLTGVGLGLDTAVLVCAQQNSAVQSMCDG